MLSPTVSNQQAVRSLRPRTSANTTRRAALSRKWSVRVRADSVDSRLERKFGLKIKESKDTWDVIVIGSGPAGATYARKLVPAGVDVLMVDAGARGGAKPGWHQKNSYKFQKDINSFASHIRSALHTLSVPADYRVVDTLDPLGYNPLPVNSKKGFVRGNQNPDQKPEDNLSAAAATYAVGGQATHWTCACPRPHPELEANMWFPDELAYLEAESLLNVRQDAFMPYSLRDKVLNQTLNKAYMERRGGFRPNYEGDRSFLYDKYGDLPQPLPLAAERNQKNKELVTWTGVDTVLGPELIRLADDTNGQHGIDGYGRFKIVDNTVCHGFSLNKNKDEVDAVYLFDALNNELLKVRAKVVVIAAGTVLTPQLVWLGLENDEKGSTYERLPALGKYLTEQPMAFCQVIWRRDIVMDKMVPNCNHNLSFDPIPIPPSDPEPNQWIPVSTGRPWHAQIHRDAFAYGDTAPNVDTRMVVDLRFFGIVDQHEYNCVEFKTCAKRGIEDFMDLPQPTFHYRYTEEERMRMHHMMEDMLYYATSIGTFLPGSEPQFMKPGLTLHIHGTTRVGLEAVNSVVNKSSLTHGFNNLYLAGNGNIPKAIACNPTLTNVAYCAMSSRQILKQLGKKEKSVPMMPLSEPMTDAVPMSPEPTPSPEPAFRFSSKATTPNTPSTPSLQTSSFTTSFPTAEAQAQAQLLQAQAQALQAQAQLLQTQAQTQVLQAQVQAQLQEQLKAQAQPQPEPVLRQLPTASPQLPTASQVAQVTEAQPKVSQSTAAVASAPQGGSLAQEQQTRQRGVQSTPREAPQMGGEGVLAAPGYGEYDGLYAGAAWMSGALLAVGGAFVMMNGGQIEYLLPIYQKMHALSSLLPIY